MRLNASLSFIKTNLQRLYNDRVAIDHILEGLRKAGMPEE